MLLTWCGIWKKIRELSDGSSLSIVYEGALWPLERLAAPLFIVSVGNDKLCADATHRHTNETELVVWRLYVITAEVEA